MCRAKVPSLSRMRPSRSSVRGCCTIVSPASVKSRPALSLTASTKSLHARLFDQVVETVFVAAVPEAVFAVGFDQRFVECDYLVMSEEAPGRRSPWRFHRQGSGTRQGSRAWCLASWARATSVSSSTSSSPRKSPSCGDGRRSF